MPSSKERSRRRLDEKPDPGPRAGCLVVGALLGIAAGAVVAFWGVPWVVNTFYGQSTVAYGEIYDQEARRIQVVDASRVDDEFHVELLVRSNRTWDVTHESWRLEISTQSARIDALPPDPEIPETSQDFLLGEERTLLLRFSATTRVDAEPVKLHLADPFLAFELQPE
jgi:hypothetical protein